MTGVLMGLGSDWCVELGSGWCADGFGEWMEC